jgi:hypothetical protein
MIRQKVYEGLVSKFSHFWACIGIIRFSLELSTATAVMIYATLCLLRYGHHVTWQPVIYLIDLMRAHCGFQPLRIHTQIFQPLGGSSSSATDYGLAVVLSILSGLEPKPEIGSVLLSVGAISVLLRIPALVMSKGTTLLLKSHIGPSGKHES